MISVSMKELGAAKWLDITDRTVKTNFKIRQGFGSIGSGADLAKLTITYKASDLAVAAVFHTSAKQVKIEYNKTTIFEGYTIGSASVETSRVSSDAWVKVTAYPYFKAISDVRVEEESVYYDVRISDPNAPQSSILHILLEKMLAGLDVTMANLIRENYVFSLPSIPVQREIFILGEGESPLSLFDKILGEFTYTRWFEGSVMRFSRPYEEDERQFIQVEFNDVLENPAIKTSPYIVSESPVVTLAKVVSFNNEVLYALDEDTDDGEANYVQVPIGEYYPEDGDADISYSSARENDNVEFYYARNPNVSYQAFREDDLEDTGLTVEKMDVNGRNAQFRLYNGTGTMVDITQIDIKAEKAYFIDRSEVVKSNVEGKKLEINADYISTREDADKYIAALVCEKKAETSTVSFSSGIPLGVRPNDLITIGDIPAVYIVKYTEVDVVTGVTKYECSMFELQDFETGMFYRMGGSRGKKSLSAYDIAKQNGFVGSEQDWLDSLGFRYEYMWSSSPDFVDPDAHIFTFAGKFVLINGLPIGDFEMQDWSRVVSAKTPERPYLWCRVNNSEPFRVTGEQGIQGEDAYVFKIKTDRTTIRKDLRSDEPQEVAYIIEKSGFVGYVAVFSSVGNIVDNSKVVLSTHHDSLKISAICYRDAVEPFDPNKNYVTVTNTGVIDEDADETNYLRFKEVVTYDEVTLSAVDYTSEPAYMGVFESTSQLPTELNGSFLISGDHALVKYNGSNAEIKLYEYDGTFPYAASGWKVSVNAKYISETVQDALSAAKAMKEAGVDIDYTDALYTHKIYVEDIVAAVISVGRINAGDIESFDYNEDANGVPSSGYKLEYAGGANQKGVIKSYGIVANSADIYNSTINRDCTVYGTLVNKDEAGNVVLKTEQSTLTPVTFSSSRKNGTNIPSAFKWSEYRSYLLTQINAMSMDTWYANQGTTKINNKSIIGIYRKTSVAQRPTTSNYHSGTHSGSITEAFSFDYHMWSLDASGKSFEISMTIPSNYPRVKVKRLYLLSPHWSTRTITWPWQKDDYACGDAIAYDNGTAFLGAAGYNTGTSHARVSYEKTDFYFEPGHTYKFRLSQGTTTNVSFGKIELEMYEDETWNVGINLISSSKDCMTFDSVVPSTGFSSVAQSYKVNGVTANIAFNATSTWPVTKYYLFYWDSGPTNTESRTTSFVQSGSIVSYNGKTSTAIGSVTYSKNSVSVITADGNFSFTVGSYYSEYNISISTQGGTLGIYAKNLMPVGSDSVIGGSDASHIWSAIYGNTIYYKNLSNLSMRKYKENIERFLDAATDILNSVDVMSFNYIGDDQYQVGFIADDTDWRLAGINHDRMDMSNCVGVLIKAFQEMSARLDRLERLLDK